MMQWCLINLIIYNSCFHEQHYTHIYILPNKGKSTKWIVLHNEWSWSEFRMSYIEHKLMGYQVWPIWRRNEKKMQYSRTHEHTKLRLCAAFSSMKHVTQGYILGTDYNSPYIHKAHSFPPFPRLYNRIGMTWENAITTPTSCVWGQKVSFPPSPPSRRGLKPRTPVYLLFQLSYILFLLTYCKSLDSPIPEGWVWAYISGSCRICSSKPSGTFWPAVNPL